MDIQEYRATGGIVSGYMPRSYNCGFINCGGSERTVAHELGHGIAGLEHVFENSNNSGKTKNLMDYSTGDELWHFQWDQIQDPSRVWMKWSKAEEEEENQIGDDYVCTMKFINQFCYAYHNKTYFSFPADGPPYFGHSTDHSMLSRSKIIHFNVRVKKDVNLKPTSNKLSEYSDYFTITCDDGVAPQELFDYFLETYDNRKHILELDIFDKSASQIGMLIENLLRKLKKNLIFSRLDGHLSIIGSNFISSEKEQMIRDIDDILSTIKKCYPELNEEE